MAFRFKFRILPAAVIGAGVLLAGKAGLLWFQFDSPASAATSEQAAALDGAASADAAETGQGDSAASDGAHGTGGDGGQPDADAEHAGTGARLGLDDDDFDPMMLTRAEIELLQGLSKRRAALEERERAFALKEQTLAAAELQLDSKIKALETLRQTVEGLLRQHEKEEEERLRSLVKIYESMKPKDAAPILSGLDLETVLDLIERMKESKSAPILALLAPERATMITEQLIARRKLPEAVPTP